MYGESHIITTEKLCIFHHVRAENTHNIDDESKISLSAAVSIHGTGM